nr:uncharacterized protein LOC108017075 [Drosophila suzukii]
MFSTYSINDVAAYEEVDGTHQEFSYKLTSEQRVEWEIQSIIRLAHQEHEAHTQKQVMGAMKKREEEDLAELRYINPFPKSLTRMTPCHDEELRVLLDEIASMKESSDEYDDDL